jgi:hypothetical protein
MGDGTGPPIPDSVNPYYRELMIKCSSKSPHDRPTIQSILDQPDLLMLESCDPNAFADYRNKLGLL